ncbi:uncharacterized protein LOC129218974 [Uloborus diversus]|uniref:uncharacterized protein LOC129218974 n=1 Tax=Uloborus diversus TaxID=327109 RepID=UPI00240A01A2|nr:uncharacterized protein LOC129218974 [Uloborus diversus]
MKLIRWVEVHIGRSRRKTKKEKDGLTINCGADIPRRRDESTPSTPLHKIEPLGKDLPHSAGSTPHRIKHPPSPHPLLRAPDALAGSRLHIRTSFLDPGLPPLSSPQPASYGSSTALDSGSPRVRCRIRTNPWLPSPKTSSGVECGWVGGIRSSSIGSESSESIAGSGFGSQSSGSLWEGYSGEPWTGLRLNGRSPSSKRLPRVTLERAVHRQRPVVEPDRLSYSGGDDEDKPYCPVTYCRPIPRSAWMDFRELTTNLVETTTQDDGESSDEAYSEDYVHSEEQDELPLEVMRSSKGPPPDTGSPQADSACGSDRDNSSCSTTPLSETPASSAHPRKSLAESKELLQDKVQRLRLERHLVDQRMQEARAEEILRREEQLILQRELVQFRRLLLIQTLSELRSQLERQGKRLHRTYASGKEGEEDAHLSPEDEAWLQDHTELVG